MNSLITLTEAVLMTLVAFSFALCVGLMSLAGLFRLAFHRLRATGR